MKRVSKDLPNTAKLALVFLAFCSCLFFPILFFNKYFLHLGCLDRIWIIPLIVFLLPFVNIFVAIVVRKGFRDILNHITSIKYFNSFPLFFYLDERPKYFRFNQLENLESILAPNDVLLRRHDNYIDGLVLGQTSFFTHAGMYYGEDEFKHTVYHSIGAGGVQPVSLSEFARCDEIAILRFNTDLVADRYWRNQNHSTNTEFFTLKSASATNALLMVSTDPGGVFDQELSPYKNVIRHIQEEKLLFNEEQYQIVEKELSMCSKLFQDLQSTPVTISRQTLDEFFPVIQDLTKALCKRKYDFAFNFTNDEKLSCIEYVWDCYKAFFPLHQITRQDVAYFNWIKTRVIVPDFFLKSEFFSLKFNSVDHAIIDAGQLYEIVHTKRVSLAKFVGLLMLSQLIVILLIYLVKRLDV